MDQNQTPLLDALERFERDRPAFFRIPGHRYERGISGRLRNMMGDGVFRFDLTEAEGLDDLHHPEGAILEAQRLAAELYGADWSWFLVNGTTCGNEAMILSAVGPGEKIIVPRNAHKSVLMGLILSGAVPVWVTPGYQEDWGVFGDVSPESVEEAFCREPDSRAVFLVSPTYYGICSDIRRIAGICHERGALLLVDEAHGSHLYFSDRLPQGALLQGADLCAQSTHKTAGSMTQSSLLHCKGNLADRERIDENLKLVMSTSPSYVLMASLDAARHELAMNGRAMMERAVELSLDASEGLERIPGFSVMREAGDRSAELDRTRLVFSGRRLGIGGYELQGRLYTNSGVSTELADYENVVAVITWANERSEIERLVSAAGQAALLAGRKRGRLKKLNPRLPDIPEAVMTPREAYFRRKRTVPWEEMKGKIAGEMAAPYPPGIPLIYPGEIITEEIYDALERCRQEKIPLHGPASADFSTFRVLEP